MFQHLLVPTDGSALSDAAVRTAVTLATAFKARITGLHVMPELHVFTHRIDTLEDTQERYAQLAERHAEQYLAAVARAAQEAAVVCEVISVTHDQPDEAIIRAS
ncbi:universal stress protein [Cupriavidus necator]